MKSFVHGVLSKRKGKNNHTDLLFLRFAITAIILYFICSFSAVASNHKIAVIFVDPRLTTIQGVFNSPRVTYEDWYYDREGYRVVRMVGLDEYILEAIMHPDVTAISFIGEGGDADRFDTPSAPTLGLKTATQWRREVFHALQSNFLARGYPSDEAYRLADLGSQNFGLDEVSNFSCWSLLDTSIGDLFVRPGGHYYGVPERYSAYPGDFIRFLLGRSDYFLTTYRSGMAAPPPVPVPRPKPSPPPTPYPDPPPDPVPQPNPVLPDYCNRENVADDPALAFECELIRRQ